MSITESHVTAQRSEPVHNTFRSLIDTLSAKIDLASRYDDYQAKAHTDEMPECANLFEEFALEERKQIDRLIHLVERDLWTARCYGEHGNGN